MAPVSRFARPSPLVKEPRLPSAAGPWRVLIVDDHPIVRTGLATLIDAEPDLSVCAQAEDEAGALAAIAAHAPDLVLVDLSLRSSSGLDLLKEVVHLGKAALVVSMHEDPTWAERSLAAGARGYLLKSEAGRNIVAAIRAVKAGRLYVSEPLSQELLALRFTRGADGKTSGIERLTDRELEVLQRIGGGFTTQQIAGQLAVSPKTIQTYRERIKEKLAIDTAAELSTWATRWVLERKGLPG